MKIAAAGTTSRLFALVPCAGTGSRAGTLAPKQYETVAGQAVVAHTLAALARVDRLAATLVVVSPEDDLFEDFAPAHRGERAWLVRAGGASRAETVANGLAELRDRGAQAHDWVLVHDAARCLIRPEWVNRLIDACTDDEVGGLLALPVADTLKQALDDSRDDRVAVTVDRRAKWAAQTPQMFRLGLLASALRAAGAAVTDEAGAVEAAGHAPKLVRGEFENFKLTWPGDFALAARLLATARPGPEIRAMVPAKDFALSQRFYIDLGFQCEFVRDGLAGYRLGETAFLLQDFYVAEHADNFVMVLNLPDLDAFWQRVQRTGLVERYGVRVQPPQQRPWGRIDMTLVDPSGVLWRIAQRQEN